MNGRSTKAMFTCLLVYDIAWPKTSTSDDSGKH